ncbi:MAG: hypothetical protein EOP93_13645 [Lysobacteraceae bacterium]|nr:MAG: hypothetical protein EOP93_13645 [Xanthomonadaceae bacterium]
MTRPWPRSILPQYADSSLTVGFGNHGRGVPYNPFPSTALGGLPSPAGPVPATDAPSPVDAASAQPQP